MEIYSHDFPKNFVKPAYKYTDVDYNSDWFDEIFFKWEKMFVFSTLCTIELRDKYNKWFFTKTVICLSDNNSTDFYFSLLSWAAQLC